MMRRNDNRGCLALLERLMQRFDFHVVKCILKLLPKFLYVGEKPSKTQPIKKKNSHCDMKAGFIYVKTQKWA